MTDQEKRMKLEMLPWQALFDFAISKKIDENEIKGNDKGAIISTLIQKAMVSDSEIENLVNDYIYGDRISFTLWNFESNLTQVQYDKINQLEGESECFLDTIGFRGLNILSVTKCDDRIEIIYSYSKEHKFINEAGKRDSIWEQHQGCLWIGTYTSYLACISKHDKMTACLINYITEKIGITLTQVKPPKSAIERCINNGPRSSVVLQGTNGEKTVVSRSDGITDAQQNEIRRIQGERFDTSGSYIALIAEDTQATIKYNIKKGSISILKHLPTSVLFEWTKSAISIILEEIDKLKGRPADEIFNDLGLEIKWTYISTKDEKVAANWFLSNAIDCLGKAQGATYNIPDYAKPLLLEQKLFKVIPRIYCECCNSYEVPHCAVCGKKLEWSESGVLNCSCGAPLMLQCSEGHRSYQADNWYIPTSKMNTMLRQNIHKAFKHDTTDFAMCIMGDILYIVQPQMYTADGVEIGFDELTCFSSLPPSPQENSREFVLRLGEKCDRGCSSEKVRECVNNCTMACLPKAFYTILPKFRPQPHKGLEYGDVSAEVKTDHSFYEAKGIIKRNSNYSARNPKSIDELLQTPLLSTSKAGEEIIRQFVEQGLNDSRAELIMVIAPQYFDNSLKGTLRFLAKIGDKKVMFIELDDVARLVEGNKTIAISEVKPS